MANYFRRACNFLACKDANGVQSPRMCGATGDFWSPLALFPRFRRSKHLKVEEPLSITEGTVTQSMLQSEYAGTQCTSISLDAICWLKNIGEMGKFDKSAIDHVIYSGHYLHIHLREVMKCSTHSDKRVAIEDLPKSCDVESGKCYRHKSREAYLSVGANSAAGDLMTLKEYLLSFAFEPFGALVTLDEYTQGVMYNRDKRWLVFDSHGDIKFLNNRAKYASCWEFSTVDGAVAFLNKIRNHQGYCLVAKPFILSGKTLTRHSSVAALVAPPFKAPAANKSSSCPGRITSTKIAYDEDPYVSMMGGFGYD